MLRALLQGTGLPAIAVTRLRRYLFEGVRPKEYTRSPVCLD